MFLAIRAAGRCCSPAQTIATHTRGKIDPRSSDVTFDGEDARYLSNKPVAGARREPDGARVQAGLGDCHFEVIFQR